MRDAVTYLTATLTALCRVAVGLSFTVLIVSVTVQVLGRSVFGASPVWTEELTRFALLYLAAFGAGLSLFSGDLVNVDLLSESLPGRGPRIMRLIGAVAILAFAVLLIGPALRFMSIGAMQTSAALAWRMDWVHMSVVVLLALLGLFAALRIAGMLSGASDGSPAKSAGEIE